MHLNDIQCIIKCDTGKRKTLCETQVKSYNYYNFHYCKFAREVSLAKDRFLSSTDELYTNVCGLCELIYANKSTK